MSLSQEKLKVKLAEGTRPEMITEKDGQADRGLRRPRIPRMAHFWTRGHRQLKYYKLQCGPGFTFLMSFLSFSAFSPSDLR